jgi:hypothetical protein
MIIELFVASILAFVWINTAPGTLINGLALNAMLIASFSTIIFNANPLLRYDGYYILSDLLEIPNLRYRSTEYTTGLIKRHLFGVKLSQPLPPFDFHCPLMSAPFAFGTTLDNIPQPFRYVSVEPAAKAHWALDTPHRRAGFAWSGSRTLVNDINRSIPLEAMRPLFTHVATPVSLQKDVRDEDRPALAGARLGEANAALDNFADTAALIEHLDLVITVDTSVAHLAGALGKAVWILLPFSPDWRWLLDRADSPWYPTARLFRQPRIGDWASVIDEVAAALADLK